MRTDCELFTTFLQSIVLRIVCKPIEQGKLGFPASTGCLFRYVFLKGDYRVVGDFIDGVMSSCLALKKVLKRFFF
jgi:hypothetical protein